MVSNSQRYKSDPKARFESTRTFLKTIINQGPDSPAAIEAIKEVNAKRFPPLARDNTLPCY